MGKIRISCKSLEAWFPSSRTIQDQTITVTGVLCWSYSAPEKLATVTRSGFLSDLLRVREKWVRYNSCH